MHKNVQHQKEIRTSLGWSGKSLTGITNDITICSNLPSSSNRADQSLSRAQSGLWHRSSLSLKAETSLKRDIYRWGRKKTPAWKEDVYWRKWQSWQGMKRSKEIILIPVKRMSDNEKSPEAFHFCQVPVSDQDRKEKIWLSTWAVSEWALEQPPFLEQGGHLDDALLFRLTLPQTWSNALIMHWLLFKKEVANGQEWCYWLMIGTC